MASFFKLSEWGKKIAQFHERAKRELKSFTDWFKTAVTHGIGYLKTAFAKDYKLTEDMVKTKERFAKTPRHKIPREEDYIEHKIPVDFNYGTIMKTKYIDKVTKEEIEKYVFIGSERRISIKEAEDIARELVMEEYQPDYITSVTAVEGRKRKK